MAIIKIKRSTGTAAPSGLRLGELAVTLSDGHVGDSGGRVFIGSGTEDANTGIASDVTVVGGKYFTEKLDHAPGTLTANSAILVDDNSKIDQLKIDEITIDGDTISSTGNLVFLTSADGDANTSGSISLNGTIFDQAGAQSGGSLSSNTATFSNITLSEDTITMTGANTMVFEIQSDSIDFSGAVLGGVGTPTANTHATTKSYVDTADALKLDLAGGTMTGALTVDATANEKILLKGSSSPMITFYEDVSGTDDDRMTFGYSSLGFGQWKVFDDDTDSSAIATLRLRSDGSVNVSGNNGITENRIFADDYHPNADKLTTARTINGVSFDGTADITIADATKLPLAGGTMSGNIAMGTNSITGLAAPANDADAATKKYVDDEVAAVSYTFSDGAGDTDAQAATGTFQFKGANQAAAAEAYSDNVDIATNIANNAMTFTLTTTGVTAGSYGSTTAIPAITVDSRGRITAVTTNNIATNFTISDGTNTDVVNGGETLTFTGGTGVTSTVANNQVTLAIGQDVDTTSDVTFNDVTVSGNLYSNDITASAVTIYGDLTVVGNTTTVNTEEINLADNTILLNSNQDSGTAPTLDAGIEVNRGSSTNVSFLWDETNDTWTTGGETITASEFNGTIDGGTF